jgi:hypothetical protein
MSPNNTVRALLAALIAIVVVAGCAGVHAGDTQSGRPQGSSLGPGMFDGTLVLGFPAKDVKPGATLGFSFPVINNVDKKPVTFLGVKLLHVPRGVTVVRYGLLSVLETDGQILDSRLGKGGDNDYVRFPNHISKHPTIDADTLSPYYPVVVLKITGPVSGTASGCQYRYEMGGRTYVQTLRCKFRFKDPNSG